MNDYISREAALNIFQMWRSDLTQQIEDSVAFPHIRSDFKVCRTQVDDCIHAVRAIPAADVRPVVRGKWIPYRPDCRPVCDWKCSACGYDPDLGTQPFFDFCPNCGAGMKEVNSGDTRTQG